MTIWNKYKRCPTVTVRDILPDRPVPTIMVRTNDPFGGDTLFGYCSWDGENLIGLDGDDYSLDEMVTKYELNYDHDPCALVYWIHSFWTPIEEQEEC